MDGFFNSVVTILYGEVSIDMSLLCHKGMSKGMGTCMKRNGYMS